MSAKKLPEQFNNYDPEKTGRGIADITKKIVEKDKERKKSMNTERTQLQGEMNTERTHFKKHKKTELETFSIRINLEDKRRLKRYFNNRDIGLSQGVRIIIKDFMERQGI